MARRERKLEVVAVLERFMANPRGTRQEIRVKLGVLSAPEFYAWTVFLCDGLLQLNPALKSSSVRKGAEAAFQLLARAPTFTSNLE